MRLLWEDYNADSQIAKAHGLSYVVYEYRLEIWWQEEIENEYAAHHSVFNNCLGQGHAKIVAHSMANAIETALLKQNLIPEPMNSPEDKIALELGPLMFKEISKCFGWSGPKTYEMLPESEQAKYRSLATTFWSIGYDDCREGKV